MTPEDHRDLANQKYSLDCIALGIPENSEAHTQCVIEKYANFNNQQRRIEERMRDLYAEPEAKPTADASTTNN